MTITITGVKRIGSIDMVASDKGPQLSFVEEYHVLADDILSTQWEVMRDAVATDPAVVALLGYNGGVQTDHLPYPGVTVARDGTCICKSLGGEKDERNARKWTFSSQWTSNLGNGQQQSPVGDSPQADPEQIIPLRETLHEPVTRARTKDLQGVAYANGAGNLYNPAMTVEEELPRWDFAQFEPFYDPALLGDLDGTYDNYGDLSAGSGTGYAELTEVTYVQGTLSFDGSLQPILTPGTVYPPGIYYGSSGTWTFAAPTDATVFFLNGAVNHLVFLGYRVGTLLLKVRSSKVVAFYGTRRRYTEYSVIYDKTNHWDKPLNAGPFFIDKKINRETGVEDTGGELDTFPYIYYSADTETEDTDLAIDETGPLGGRLAFLRSSQPNALIYDPLTPSGYYGGGRDAVDGFPLSDGSGIYSKIVKLPDGSYTRRALKPNPQQQYPHIEMVNHDVANFAVHLRIV
jgi:hypothetical protein